MAPYRYDNYRSPYVQSIAESMLIAPNARARAAEVSGQAQAHAAQQSGQAWGNAAQDIGQSIASIPAQMQQQKATALRERVLNQQVESAGQEMQARKLMAGIIKNTPKLDQNGLKLYDIPSIADQFMAQGGDPSEVQKHLGAFNDSMMNFQKAQVASAMTAAKGLVAGGNDPDLANDALDIFEANHVWPSATIAKYRQAIAADPKNVEKLTAAILGITPKEPAPYTLNQGDVRYSGDNQPVASVPAAQKPPTVEDLVQVEEGGKPVYRPKSEAVGKPAYRAPVTPPASEPLVAIMGPDGKAVLVPRGQAVGKTPATVREQGKTVTSGDAGRTAEFDSALDDLTTLRNTLGTTGAASKVGAVLPNVVTEMTGWGADAKARQGTIDRIKQVIGKTLEGGVLRKEDEIKYVKILPTIGDPPSVAKAKLAGLEMAIRLKRQRFLENLTDAGYDTSQFSQQSTPVADVIVVRDKNGKLVPQRAP